MTIYSPLPLRFNPGIQRDGTALSAPNNWLDGLWTRFHNGKPKKMGGYSQLSAQMDGIQRSFENCMDDGNFYLHAGSNINLSQIVLSSTGVAGSPTTRTPGTYSMQGDELWQMGVSYDPIVNNAATLIAHPGRNLNDISNSVATPIYSGPCGDVSQLTENTGLTSVSGGICVVKPYLTFFGSDGYFGWGGPNKLNDMTVGQGGGETNPTAQKIVAGRSIRGGNGPSGLYWSLDTVFRTSFIGGSATWAFDELATDVSVLSSRCMGSLGDSIWYWPGQQCFYVYDGQVNELPNTTNADWFFKHVNYEQRQKCFTVSIKRWGEIWFCFPYGSATECTNAVIYNAREKVWYDTELPHGGRSGGISSGLYRYPILGGTENVGGGLYRIWQHEDGVNEVRGSITSSVRAYIESSNITMLTGSKPENTSLSCIGVEPDIEQVGEMTMTITGEANSRAPTVDEEAITFSAGPVAEDEQILHPKVERRQMRFRFESNTEDGDFELGNSFAHVAPGSGRQTG